MPQLESKKIVLTEILSQCTFLEYKLAKWSRNDFPLESWELTGMKFDGLSNLFGLIYYFLTLIVSSAEAEHGFSILKSLKPSSCSNQPTFTTAIIFLTNYHQILKKPKKIRTAFDNIVTYRILHTIPFGLHIDNKYIKIYLPACHSKTTEKML